MNWPNRLSILRVALIPVCVLLLQFPNTACQLLALIAFAVAAFTDFLDGYLARKHHLVTNFGKFLDPVADKLLVLSTFIALCGLGRFPAWAGIVILFRELAVDGLRLIAVEQGKVIAAGKLGKIKTTLQMLTIVLLLLNFWQIFAPAVEWVMISLSVVMTLFSGADYFIRNRDVLRDKKVSQ